MKTQKAPSGRAQKTSSYMIKNEKVVLQRRFIRISVLFAQHLKVREWLKPGTAAWRQSERDLHIWMNFLNAEAGSEKSGGGSPSFRECFHIVSISSGLRVSFCTQSHINHRLFRREGLGGKKCLLYEERDFVIAASLPFGSEMECERVWLKSRPCCFVCNSFFSRGLLEKSTVSAA